MWSCHFPSGWWDVVPHHIYSIYRYRMRPSRRVLLTTRLQASKSSCSSKSPLCVSVIALATAANTHLPSCRSREQHQNCQQQLTITSLLASGTRPPSAPQVSLQHRQHRRSPGLHRGNDRLEGEWRLSAFSADERLMQGQTNLVFKA